MTAPRGKSMYEGRRGRDERPSKSLNEGCVSLRPGNRTRRERMRGKNKEETETEMLSPGCQQERREGK